jgi:hypothetical protein
MNKHLALVILGLVLWIGGIFLPFPLGLLFTIPGGFMFGWNAMAYCFDLKS